MCLLVRRNVKISGIIVIDFFQALTWNYEAIRDYRDTGKVPENSVISYSGNTNSFFFS